MVYRYHLQTHYPNNDNCWAELHVQFMFFYTGEVVYPALLHHFLKSLYV